MLAGPFFLFSMPQATLRDAPAKLTIGNEKEPPKREQNFTVRTARIGSGIPFQQQALKALALLIRAERLEKRPQPRAPKPFQYSLRPRQHVVVRSLPDIHH